MKLAMIYWALVKKINNMALNKSDETIKKITYKVNGGYNSLSARNKYTNKAYDVLKKKRSGQ